MKFEFIEGTWKKPYISIEKYKGAEPAGFYPAWNAITFGESAWCDDEDIIYMLNHELDHWAQYNGSDSIVHFSGGVFGINHIVERCNAFSQLDNPILWGKTEQFFKYPDKQ